LQDIQWAITRFCWQTSVPLFDNK